MSGRKIPVLNHEMALGETVKFDISVKDPNGVVIPITGYTGKYAIHDRRGDLVLEHDPSVVGNAFEIRALVENLEPGTYRHAFRMRDTVNVEIVMFHGDLVIRPEVARFV